MLADTGSALSGKSLPTLKQRGATLAFAYIPDQLENSWEGCAL
jgi:hypothetical protein